MLSTLSLNMNYIIKHILPVGRMKWPTIIASKVWEFKHIFKAQLLKPSVNGCSPAGFIAETWNLIYILNGIKSSSVISVITFVWLPAESLPQWIFKTASKITSITSSLLLFKLPMPLYLPTLILCHCKRSIQCLSQCYTSFSPPAASCFQPSYRVSTTRRGRLNIFHTEMQLNLHLM